MTLAAPIIPAFVTVIVIFRPTGMRFPLQPRLSETRPFSFAFLSGLTRKFADVSGGE
jgi:hypothetical protein